ncbi:MAG: hypothetical protein V3W14_12030 [Candidatus Neomarinimicrobiota bacterium]
MLGTLIITACSWPVSPGRTSQRIYAPLTAAANLESELPMGVSFFAGRTTFRLFAPHATQVKLIFLPRYDSFAGEEIPLRRDNDGVWSVARLGRFDQQIYGYRLWGPEGPEHAFDPSRVVSDPYSKVVITRNSRDRQSRSLNGYDNFPWRGDKWTGLKLSDAIIYQLHLEDIAATNDSASAGPGAYLALVSDNSPGGLKYFIELGVNAVALLPIIDHQAFEPATETSSTSLSSSPYSYMRSPGRYGMGHLFSPAARYGSVASRTPDEWIGSDGSHVRELKEAIHRLHQNNIAVILYLPLAVISSGDPSPLMYIDKAYYFQMDGQGRPIVNESDGLQLRLEAPMMRRMIVDAVNWWQTEYHIDGFLFGAAQHLDDETAGHILEAARQVNPSAIIIGDTEGNNQAAVRLADVGWAILNDEYLAGIRGVDPTTEPGFILGKWSGTNSAVSIERYFQGSPREQGGQFRLPEQSVNFLASYNTTTLGDFIRIGGRFVDPRQPVTDRRALGTVRGKQLAYNTLAALGLLTAQGAVFIPAGQEFAHSRMGRATASNGNDESGSIDWDFKGFNQNLFEYYRGLIKLRRTYRAFHQADPTRIQFFPGRSDFGLAMLLPREITGDPVDFFLILNGHPVRADEFALPAGERWKAVATWSRAGTDTIVAGLSGVISIPPTAGMILIR